MHGFRVRPADLGRRRWLELARRNGRDVLVARVTSGMTQARLAKRAGVSQSTVCAAENGDPSVSLEIRARLAAACGHELAMRMYPTATISLRDSGQLILAQAIVAVADPRWTVSMEAPVAPDDLRAVDLLLGLPEELDDIEVERRLVDAQAQVRAAQVKRDVLAVRDPRPVRLIIAVADTRLNRRRLDEIAPLLARSFPVSSRRIWHALRHGEPVGGDGILLVRRPTRGT